MGTIKFYTSEDQMYFEMEEEKVNKEQKIQELSNKIDELKKELKELQKKPYEISYPEDGAKVWSFDCYLGTLSNGFFNIEDRADRHSYNTGLLFDSYKEVNQFLKEQTLIKKIKCWAKEQQGDWKFNSDKSTTKYDIYYSGMEKKLKTFEAYTATEFKKLPHFKSREIAQACIDEFGDEILEVFC